MCAPVSSSAILRGGHQAQGDLFLGRADFGGPLGHFLFEFLFVAPARHDQPATFEGVRHIDHQFVGLKRLDDVAVSAQLKRVNGGGPVIHGPSP